MARGFTYALYTADDGVTQYIRQVDRDQVADPGRGWAQGDLSAGILWPQRAFPRRVFGVSPTTGRRGNTVVAHPNALLWSGEQTTFQVETNDPDVPTDQLIVTRRRGESFPMVHQIA